MADSEQSNGRIVGAVYWEIFEGFKAWKNIIIGK
jgi:hypothetical protein